MICIEAQHFNLNRILLLAIGLWVYQQSKLVRLQFTFLFSILMTVVFFQCTTFLTSNVITSYFIINVLSTTFFYIIFIIIYFSYGINVEDLKDLLTQLQHICNRLNDANEYTIIKQYNYNAKCYTVALAIVVLLLLLVVGLSGIFGIILNQYWNICDVIFSINESRPSRMQILIEYFIDQEKYFSLILLHITTATCVEGMGMLATGTLLIAYFEHTCGLFKIARYNVQWYLASLHIQKMILFLLQRASKDFILTIDGLFVASFECFTMLVNTSVSYFTAMYSTR